MNRWIACAALLAVLALAAGADDKKDEKKSDSTKPADALAELQKDYIAKIRAEKDKGKQQELIEELCDKLVGHARKHSKDESAGAALVMVLNNTGAKSKAREAALDLLKKEFVKSKAIGPSLRGLAGNSDENVQAFV